MKQLSIFPGQTKESKSWSPDDLKRQGLRDGKAMSLFSTIRLRFCLKNDGLIEKNLARETKNNAQSNDTVESAREHALHNLQILFKNFLDYFYANRIHVCFGSIGFKKIYLPRLSTLTSQLFPTFVQAYSWAMVISIGFRLEIQLLLSKSFLFNLRKYATPQEYDQKQSDIDNRIYRLCLYIWRRSSEYFFLDLDKELLIGFKEYEFKSERCRSSEIPIANIQEPSDPSTAYVPSVVITPTTISIRPLKLCKMNRILREERFGGHLNFALVELRDEAQRLLFASEYRALRSQIARYLKEGFLITPSRRYVYLHHSQSQVKTKQFWFYYHDAKKGNLSLNDAYLWMGNFDKEHVVAKHTARIALCFTSTDATIQIPAEQVTYIRDVERKTNDVKYTFTDGVGTISRDLQHKIQKFIGRRLPFSVLQIRYGGCKGTVSVDPGLNGQQYQLLIRDSMNKFTSDHDILELCKCSAPRALFLNRQDIVLLDSREIPYVNFLVLQNENFLWLVRALLTSATAYELLQEKLLRVFDLRIIAENINIVEEQFFVKLLITCAFNIIRELLDRTRIRISKNKARNMFGIVDEYAVLNYGEVFVQYSNLNEQKLRKEPRNDENNCTILTGPVVLTKNPCHHPGDLRTFTAVDHQKLRHLIDCVVFPQKGPRPHPNEISGSDLDGDEYVVIWHEDLLPKTDNESPYEYDSQEKPAEMDRPITRDDINEVVISVSEQDCLGRLSNIHLAYVDKEGVKSKICTKLAGDISQEVDAAKTGKHPLTEEQISQLSAGLGNQLPDYMKARGSKTNTPSAHILGKLFRAAQRSVVGWSRAVRNHGNARHIHVALELAAGMLKQEEDDDDENEGMPFVTPPTFIKYPLDSYLIHPNCEKYINEMKTLFILYRQELIEIINLYHFQDEIDLFCRCDSMDASSNGNKKKGSIEDSAASELQYLIQRIKNLFYAEFNRCQCRLDLEPERKTCNVCREGKLAKAACAYIITYHNNNSLPIKSNRRILSFAWYFAGHLVELRRRNRPTDSVDESHIVIGRAMSVYLNDIKLQFKVFIADPSLTPRTVDMYLKIPDETEPLFDVQEIVSIEKIDLLRACFVEILHDWLTKQAIFGEICNEISKKPLVPDSIWHELLGQFLSGQFRSNVRLVFATKFSASIVQRYEKVVRDYRLQWTDVEHEKLQNMFEEMHSIAIGRAKLTKLAIWAYLDEYLILALQCIAIEKKLVNDWICPASSS